MLLTNGLLHCDLTNEPSAGSTTPIRGMEQRLAVLLLGDAARAGSVAAMCCLACLMALGAHLPQSWRGALGLLGPAAELGSASARDFIRSRAVFNTPAENVA